MKYALIHPDVTGRYDPPGSDTVKQIPNRVDDPKDADVLLMPVARFDEFKFDERLNDINKPWVLFDWCEFGWDDPMTTSYRWGRDRLSHPSFQNPEWEKFDKFVRDHPPIMMFQRELRKEDASDYIQPIDYLNWLPELGGENRDDFMKRPLDVSFNFGRSHEGRMWMHGAIFQNAGRFGYDVISEFSHIEKEIENQGRKWLSVHSPHYARLDVREVQKVNRKSIISLVLPGAGQKTFRLSECCADGIMAMPRHNLACAYPWTGNNSIQLPPLNSIEDANESVKIMADALMGRDYLYEIYCRAMENALNYRAESYMRRHVHAQIEKKI
jgi:hypothetical protein